MLRSCFGPLLVLTALCGAGRAEDAREIVNWARSTYQVEVVLNGAEYPLRRPHYTVGGEDPPAESAAAYLPLLRRELAKYPPALLKQVGTKKIVLARKLSVDGQARAAVPDFADMTLLLDVERGAHSRAYQERVFHHEFFHLIDRRLNGPLLTDPGWARLNPPEFRYGPGGRFMQSGDRDPSAPTRSVPGFLTLYGTSAVEEDKAELFSFLFTDSVFLLERAARDPVVRAKWARMRELLQGLCPDLDDRFCRRLTAHHAAGHALAAGCAGRALVPSLPAPFCVVVPALPFAWAGR